MTKRHYTAAENVARYGDFLRSSGSADYELLNNLAKLREKARFLARNSATMRRYIQLMRDNVVGDNGFTLQAYSPRVEAAFRQWSEYPTVDGHMSMVDFLDQMVGTWCRDGEYFVEFVVGTKYSDSIALNPLEPDMIDETLNTTYGATGNRIKMGVEIDADGRAVAYHVFQQHPGDTSWTVPFARRHRRVPADRIIHVFEKLRPGQTRGEPPSASIINSIKMLDGYREAETMNRRIAAAMMGFFSRDVPRAEGIQGLADGKDDEDELFEINVEPGTLKQLPDGMRFDKFDPGGSQTDYHQFEAQVKKDIAMGLGISTFSLGMETEGVSYSTGRSVIQEDRDYYRARQAFFIRQAMRPIFRQWAKMHALSPGSSIAPSRLTAVLADFKFRGRGWTWIDPAKDIDANARALETLQTSYSRIAAQHGMDVTDLFSEIQRDRELMKTFGLQPITSEGNVGENSDAGDESESE